MANTKSARKMTRVIERRRQRNRPIRSAAKTYVSKARALISDGELEAGKTAAAQALQALDKAVQKGVLHRNNASRRKSRLMKNLNAALQAQTASAGPEQAQAK